MIPLNAPERAVRADITPVEIDQNVDWSQVGGLDHHVRALKEMVMFPLMYPELFQKFNVTPPKGVLFYGPPGTFLHLQFSCPFLGTGKTLVARALANTCSKYGQRVSFFMRKGADILSKWVGEAERQLRLLFENAKRFEPSIIFFDEIDGTFLVVLQIQFVALLNSTTRSVFFFTCANSRIRISTNQI